MAENATVVTTVVGTADAGETLTYSISGGADAANFTINASTGALSFVAAPDFEAPTDAGANNVYDVTVQVSDGSTTDTQAIAVTVTNANEAPVITSNGGLTTAAVSVAENTTAVTTVTSTDVDAGATLTYSISGGADAAKFAINSSTGALTFVAAPDAETPTDSGANNVYDVIVQVSDGAITDTQAIAVTVTNVNDAPSVITSNGGGATAAVNVAENTTAVTTVVGTADAGATLTYSISGGADAAKFAINASTGALTFVAAPDFEAATDVGANNVYDVTVQVSDGTTTDTQAIAVTVTDISVATIVSNGGGATAAVNVAENTSAVTTVVGSGDLGGTLTYSITGGADAAKFAINSSTGALSFVAAPNFEAPTDAGANNVYDVTVQVSDGTATDTQAIAVTVTNANDAPVITSNAGGATAAVNAAENTTAVTTVTATDVDAGATLTYSISGGADAAKFTINPTTGALSFLAAPDFETPTDVGANNVYDVTVQVSDGAATDTQAIAVTVTNANEAPVITSNGGLSTAAVSVAENVAAVTTVTSTDVDAGATLTYSITGGADAAKFTINSSTGALAFVAAPNFEAATDSGANNVYDVTVQVSDGTATDTQAIAVTVTNVNEAPVITSNAGGATAAVNVAENATAVTTVTATDVDAGTTLTYSISGGADAAKFAINASTGVLTFVAAPDFETPTDGGADNVYDVTVQVSDGTNTDTQAIAVTVTAVNDNTPAITSDAGGATAAVNVAENTTAVTTVTATDADAGTTLVYSINGGADAAKFTINASTGALSFLAAPDAEVPTDVGANNVYDVTVQASDGTNTDTQAIAVTVTGVNDNTPVITSNAGGATAAANVAENTTAVTTVTATDADAGTTLTYSISGGADAAKFAINSSTGVLTFVAAPDFEAPTDTGANNVYDVTVQVSDGTNTDTQAIAVTVTDVGALAITSNGGGATAAVNVAENSATVATVAAVSENAITYSISGGADAAKFTINPTTGALTFVAAPDFEASTDVGANNVYDVIVQANDGATTDTQAIAVTVTNVNEAPVITSNAGGATAAVNVAENATAVTTVTATDVDAGTTLTYSISGGADAAKFAINSSTGALTFVAAPDFEAPTDGGADNVYDVTVQVSDGTTTDTQAIAVTVTAVNDNTPVITSNAGGATAAMNVAENTTAVTTVTATDADAGTTLVYSINGGADAAKFTINSSTGALSFLAAPDAEVATDVGADNVYDVTVQASDGTNTDTQAIAVTVTGVNDNTPAITSNGAGATAAMNVVENTTAVTTVTATDADAGSTLTYSISGGADALKFAINSSTGVLTFVAAQDFEAPTDTGADNVYDVTVQVSDGTTTDTQAIAVTVTNANEAPVITSNAGGATAAVNVAENATAVTTVTATDVDAGSTLTYSISGGADSSKFAIDPSTGVLTFAVAPNFEVPTDSGANNVYDVTVQVSDGTATDTQAIAVTVTNVNEAPVITSDAGGATAAVNVAENATAVTTVTATDVDAGATQTYTISGGADAAKFAINSSTGALTFVAAPDFEAPTDGGADNVYDVIVQVSDGTATDTQSIAVTVTAVNDNTPAITSNGAGAAAAVNVAENATAVTTVTATDADAGTGSTLTYSISGGVDAGKFTINPTTGVLAFAVAPDFEVPTDSGANNVYDVTVQVSDGTNTDTQAIAVTVTGVNDNTPVITSNAGGATAGMSVAENTTAVTTVTATDADAGSTLTYSISGGTDALKFAINSSTGVLTFVAAPDFEAPTDGGANNIYDVTVQVSDGTTTDTQAIAVTVTDVGALAITSNGGGASATVNVAENSSAATTVAAVSESAITYSIVGGADAAKFTINPTTGALSFLAAPDFETPTDVGANNVYDVTVQASDGGTITQAIAVTVTDVDEFAAAPSAPDLIVASDTGSLTSDDLTNDTTPTVTGSGAEAGATVTLYDSDGTTVLGTTVADGAGAWTITSSVLAAGAHTLSVKQTDLASNVSAASGTLAINIDTTRPTPGQTSFVGTGTTTTDLSINFSEAVTAATGDFTVIRNPSWVDNGPQSSVTVNSVTAPVSPTDLVVNLTTAGGTFGGGGVVLVRYDQTGSDVMDLAGNKVSSREFYVGGGGNNVIDLSGYNPVHDSQTWLQQLRGNAGDDLLIGTSVRDIFVDNAGTDIIVGGGGDDSITLSETRATGTQFSDIVRIGVGESTVSAWDVIGNASTAPTTSGFDITSATAGLHDRLDLPSNVIAGNATDADGTDFGAIIAHSITNGIITFQAIGLGPVVIQSGAASFDSAISYLTTNITTSGTTVAFKVDTNNNTTIEDAVDSLFVFQDGGANPDILVQLAGLGGINSAILGTSAGANVVQLITSVPTVVNVTSITGAPAPLGAGATVSIEVTFSEAVTVTGTPQLTLETGTTDWAVNYVSGSGTATLHFTYTVQAGDSSLDLDYFSDGALVLNGGTIKDATGTDAILTLPTPGATGSLGANRAIVIEAGPPGAPSTPDLVTGSDSGVNTADNITNDTTPTLTGTGASGATVTLYDSDGTTVLGTTTVDGGGAWTITTSTLAQGTHNLTAKQTNGIGDSLPSSALAVTIDTTAPLNTGATFTESVNSTINLVFNEAVIVSNTNGLTLHKNPNLNDGNGGFSAPSIATGFSGSNSTTLSITTVTTVGATDVVRAYYNTGAGGSLADLAGNPFSSGEIWIGGTGINNIDLSNYGSSLPITLRGNGGNDDLTGTSAADTLIDGGGPATPTRIDGPFDDFLEGGRGADTIRLVENGTPAFRMDLVYIEMGHSTASAMDVITNAPTNAGSGFDIASATLANHDVLILQSNAIVGDVTNVDGTDSGALATHSITSGIVTFQNASNASILINAGNLNAAIAYLGSNITDPGATVAFRVDSNGNGTINSGVDALYVFQNNGTIPLAGGYVVPDTVVKIDQLVNVQSATLAAVTMAQLMAGTAPNNAVWVLDTLPPQPIGFAVTSNGVELNFAENAFATASVALSLKQNGITDMTITPITGVTGNGTTTLAAATNVTLAADDWVFLQYLATDATNGISDAAGNVLIDDEPGYGGSAEGSSGNNTIDLSGASYNAVGGYDLNGAGGNDILTGSAVGDYIDGGTGADTMTGGTGQEYYSFEQGDSPVGNVNLGGNGILDNGDTFTFAGGVDRITDLVSNEGMNLNVPNQDLANAPGLGWMGASNATPATAVLPTNGLATDQGFFMVRGNYSGPTFTVNNAGADTLVVYDGDATAGVTQTGIVLSGVTLSQLNAFSGSNFISHI